MVHAVSTAYLRFERMSPQAAALAIAMHAAVAAALWWSAPLKFKERFDDTVDITMVAAVPAPPSPTPAPQPPQPEAAPPQQLPSTPPRAAATRPQPPAAARLGLPPPAPATDDKPTQAPAKDDQPQEAPAAAPPDTPTVEQSLPTVEPPVPPLTLQDFIKLAPPPKPQDIARPAPRPPPPPPLQPSPLGTRPPAPDGRAPREPQNTLVNPAEALARNRVIEDYLWTVARKFSQHRVYSRDRAENGTVIVRFTLARDGRLLDISILQSSGIQTLDKGVLEAIRAGSPYAPLPPEISGTQATFNLPVSSRYRE